MQFQVLFILAILFNAIIATPIPTPRTGLHSSMVDVPTYRIRAKPTTTLSSITYKKNRLADLASRSAFPTTTLVGH